MKFPLKLLTTLLLSLPLLSSCDVLKSQLQPSTMTIEYDEEVKLHDGSMIWVHITRHYFLAGEIAHSSAYMPGNVEISWDTGFKGVGRKSVFFDETIYSINKYNGKWYLLGAIANSSPEYLNKSVNCKNIGIKMGEIGCLVVIDEKGFSQNESKLTIHYNILEPVRIKDWGDVPQPLNNQSIKWDDKLKLQRQQHKDFRRIGKSYSIN